MGIAETQKNIGKNDEGIAGNPRDIAENDEGIAVNGESIAVNGEGIAGNPGDTAENDEGIAGNPRDIAENDEGIAGNPGDTAENDEDMAGNPGDIVDNDEGIAGNPRDISEKDGGMAANQGDLDLQTLETFLADESKFMLNEEFYECEYRVALREKAVYELARLSENENFGAEIPYLALYNLDLYLLLEYNDIIFVMEDTQLAFRALCCLTMILKAKVPAFSIHDLLERNGQMNEENRIVNTEMEISGVIGSHKIIDISALDFIPSFNSYVQSVYDIWISSRTIHQIVIQAQGDLPLRRCWPSAIFASAYLASVWLLWPNKFEEFKARFITSSYLIPIIIEAAPKPQEVLVRQVKAGVESSIRGGEVAERVEFLMVEPSTVPETQFRLCWRQLVRPNERTSSSDSS